MKPPPFRYVRAGSLEDALSALASEGDEARLLAGGQSLIAMMNLRLVRPSALVDVNGVSELDYIRSDDGTLTVGALTRLSAAEELAGDRGRLSPDERGDRPHRSPAHPQPRDGRGQSRARGSVIGAAGGGAGRRRADGRAEERRRAPRGRRGLLRRRPDHVDGAGRGPDRHRGAPRSRRPGLVVHGGQPAQGRLRARRSRGHALGRGRPLHRLPRGLHRQRRSGATYSRGGGRGGRRGGQRRRPSLPPARLRAVTSSRIPISTRASSTVATSPPRSPGARSHKPRRAAHRRADHEQRASDSHRERQAVRTLGRAAPPAVGLHPRGRRPHRDPRRVRARHLRHLHGADERPDRAVVPHLRGAGARAEITTVESLGTPTACTRCRKRSGSTMACSAGSVPPPCCSPPRSCWTPTPRPAGMRSRKPSPATCAAAPATRPSWRRWRPPPPGSEEQNNERSHQSQHRRVRERLPLDRPEHEAGRGPAAADRPRKVHRRHRPPEHGPRRGAAKPARARTHQEHRHEPGRSGPGRGAGDDRRASRRADRPPALLLQPAGRPALHRDRSGPPRGRDRGRGGRGEPLHRRGRHRPHRRGVRAAARGGRPRGRHHLQRRRGAPPRARAEQHRAPAHPRLWRRRGRLRRRGPGDPAKDAVAALGRPADGDRRRDCRVRRGHGQVHHPRQHLHVQLRGLADRGLARRARPPAQHRAGDRRRQLRQQAVRAQVARCSRRRWPRARPGGR